VAVAGASPSSGRRALAAAVPDWSYQTVLRPVLRRLSPAAQARVARGLGRLGRNRVTGRLIAVVGDMEPGPDEAVQAAGRAFPSPIVAGHALPGGAALDPLVARFGVGAVGVQPEGGRWHGAKVAQEAREPGDAVAALAAGADLVAADAGLLASGPGFAKRANEALRHARQAPTPPIAWRWATLREPWTGMLAMALVLLVAGLAAAVVGATRVLLPYDEAFLRTDRAGLRAIDPRLLDFLAHDRISFAATAASFAILLLAIAANAARHRERWARRTLVASAGVGFAGYFLFLAFGYFEPLHLVVWLAALACFLWGLRGKDLRPPRVPVPDLRDDAAWRRALVGQLGFVGLSLGLIVAGVTISAIACLQVFVHTDLQFLGTDRATLAAANPRLLPLVAHDRAGFGNALAADGLAVLLVTLWGMRRGARWVWWSLVASGTVGFAGVLWIHARIGYVAAAHLAPAYLAAAVFAACAWLTHGFLAGRAAAPAAGLQGKTFKQGGPARR